MKWQKIFNSSKQNTNNETKKIKKKNMLFAHFKNIYRLYLQFIIRTSILSYRFFIFYRNFSNGHSTAVRRKRGSETNILFSREIHILTRQLSLRERAFYENKSVVTKVVTWFKCIGSIISKQGTRIELISKAAPILTAVAKVRSVWKDKNINLKWNIRLLHTLAFSIFLYTFKSWTLSAELQGKYKH